MNYVSFIPISHDAAARTDETILDVARRAGVPLGSACGGIGICGRCRVMIVDGEEHLTPPTMLEARFSSGRNERLGCQAVVTGDCSVTTSYW